MRTGNKTGRPSLGDRVQVNVRLPRELKEAVDAARGNRSIDSWFEMAVRNALRPVALAMNPELAQREHEHVRARPLHTEWKDGVAIRVYQCHCGEAFR